MFNALNVRIILIVCLFFISLSLEAQDIHFSQVQTVQQQLNAACTGVMEPQLRLTMNYRNQWRRLGFPFVSDYVSLEGRTRAFNRPIGIGAFLLHDQSSSNYLRADKVYFSVNHSFYFRNHQIVVGVQPGLVIKSLDKAAITFGSQFDPDLEIYNPGLASGEGLLNENLNYFDLNTGVFWRSSIRNIFYTAGFSVGHITRPAESFYKGIDTPGLPLKFTVHGNVAIPLGERYTISPLYMYTSSRGTREFIGGAIVTWNLQNNSLSIKRVYGFLQMRINPPENVDAFILGAGTKFHAFDLGISYDLTVSGLRKTPGILGAFELSVQYNLNRQKTESDNEPCFML